MRAQGALLSGTGIKAAAGESGLLEAAERPAQWVIGAITGAAGLKPTLAAAERGRRSWRSPTRKRWSVPGPYSCAGGGGGLPRCLPVDSEHNAALPGDERKQARGRAARDLTASAARSAPPVPRRCETRPSSKALKHPNWSMGAKGDLDSATLMKQRARTH
jgi:1-deoxy-D-xylulose-5-phosphate reductoisomerase